MAHLMVGSRFMVNFTNFTSCFSKTNLDACNPHLCSFAVFIYIYIYICIVILKYIDIDSDIVETWLKWTCCWKFHILSTSGIFRVMVHIYIYTYIYHVWFRCFSVVYPIWPNVWFFDNTYVWLLLHDLFCFPRFILCNDTYLGFKVPPGFCWLIQKIIYGNGPFMVDLPIKNGAFTYLC